MVVMQAMLVISITYAKIIKTKLRALLKMFKSVYKSFLLDSNDDVTLLSIIISKIKLAKFK